VTLSEILRLNLFHVKHKLYIIFIFLQ